MPSQTTSKDLQRHIYAVQRYVEFTSPAYTPLLDPGVPTHPIPCFGDPATAFVVTVGLNPSKSEFTHARDWPPQMDHLQLSSRCREYFGPTSPAAPHPWFKQWSEGIEPLEVSYACGSAVHLDLSPRATRFVSDLEQCFEQDLFLRMLERDAWTFFASLSLCKSAKLILMAGSATGRYYINEFIQRVAPDHGHTLDRPFDRRQQKGKGKVCWHWLSAHRRQIPVFFCSASPSSHGSSPLPARLKDNASALKGILAREPSAPFQLPPP